MRLFDPRRLPFWRVYTTRQNRRYWLRKTDIGYWDKYHRTWGHPKRHIISAALAQLQWFSLFEVGTGSGPNLRNIISHFPGRQLGGCDINPVAIESANKNFQNILLQVCAGDDITMSDKSTDVALSDAYLIYVGPFQIKKHLEEIKRITRKHVVLCEYHSKSFLKRWILRVFSGRHAYNYEKLLKKVGFYDVQIFKLPPVERDNDEGFRYIIIANCPSKV